MRRHGTMTSPSFPEQGAIKSKQHTRTSTRTRYMITSANNTNAGQHTERTQPDAGAGRITDSDTMRVAAE